MKDKQPKQSHYFIFENDGLSCFWNEKVLTQKVIISLLTFKNKEAYDKKTRKSFLIHNRQPDFKHTRKVQVMEKTHLPLNGM